MDFGCDKIRCISLSERIDKRSYISDTMKNLNIDFEFFNAIRDKELPSRGCFKSHFQIISEAYKEGVNRLMIFEDDIGIDNKPRKIVIKKIRKFLDTEDWDIFFLGGTPCIWNSTIKEVDDYPDIYKGSIIAAHAYILSKRGIQRYRNIIWGKPYKIIDADIYCLNDKSYAYLPEIFHQRSVKNDIGLNTTKYIEMRTLAGRILTKYAININIRLDLVGVIIVLMCVILVHYFRTKSN